LKKSLWLKASFKAVLLWKSIHLTRQWVQPAKARLLFIYCWHRNHSVLAHHTVLDALPDLILPLTILETSITNPSTHPLQILLTEISILFPSFFILYTQNSLSRENKLFINFLFTTFYYLFQLSAMHGGSKVQQPKNLSFS